ncbi:hypothetical protein LEP1GSC052_3223 [Leptospira kmetyi serovar Malaysia str. Bejo-Iso9]|nr:hypothetical protein LEP1GSC052_3223 [Leptospira kmetyi serovar Malaysia str. Bejo-Iso9]
MAIGALAAPIQILFLNRIRSDHKTIRTRFPKSSKSSKRKFLVRKRRI